MKPRPSLRDLTPIDDDWRSIAVCATSDPEAWFPNTESDNHGEYMFAKSLCKTCPLVAPCAEYAIVNVIPHGLWGGLTPTDRQRIRRERGMTPIPGVSAA